MPSAIRGVRPADRRAVSLPLRRRARNPSAERARRGRGTLLGLRRAREQGDKRCADCRADFTLREQDLETICPKCFARVSDQARFCDHCGQPLAAEPLAIDETPLVCPACQHQQPLTRRSIAGQEVLECPDCAGMWLGNATLHKLVAQAERDGPNAVARSQSRETSTASATHPHPGSLPEGEGAKVRPHGYLPCPECGR